jgi:hypothetical protein
LIPISAIKIDDLDANEFNLIKKVPVRYIMVSLSPEMIDLSLRSFWIQVYFRFLNWFFDCLR